MRRSSEPIGAHRSNAAPRSSTNGAPRTPLASTFQVRWASTCRRRERTGEQGDEAGLHGDQQTSVWAPAPRSGPGPYWRTSPRRRGPARRSGPAAPSTARPSRTRLAWPRSGRPPAWPHAAKAGPRSPPTRLPDRPAPAATGPWAIAPGRGRLRPPALRRLVAGQSGGVVAQVGQRVACGSGGLPSSDPAGSPPRQRVGRASAGRPAAPAPYPARPIGACSGWHQRRRQHGDGVLVAMLFAQGMGEQTPTGERVRGGRQMQPQQLLGDGVLTEPQAKVAHVAGQGRVCPEASNAS